VIATPGARQRLQGASGEELVVADEPRDFARKIVHLLGDGGARAELASRGQGFVTEHYSWSHMALQFVQLVEAVKQPTGSPSRPVTEPLARAQL
jgi:glycosyltransferase involved in cell wall biosynthesis